MQIFYIEKENFIFKRKPNAQLIIWRQFKTTEKDIF